MAEQQRKRQRASRPSAEDLLHKARFIMHDDPFKERAPQAEDKHFRALFGCSVIVALTLWTMMLDHDLLPVNATITHLLWTLMYLKVYPTESAMQRMTKVDPKTSRKYVSIMLSHISLLEPYVVSLLFDLPA